MAEANAAELRSAGAGQSPVATRPVSTPRIDDTDFDPGNFSFDFGADEPAEDETVSEAPRSTEEVDAAAGGEVLLSDVCPVFEYFQIHQPRVSAQWPMNKMNLNRREIFRGKILQRKTQTKKLRLEERTLPAPNP